MKQYYIGIDFSLNSPCVSILDTKNKDCITISFCRKKRPQFAYRRIVGADRGYYTFESSVLVTPEPESDTRKFYYTANAIVNGIRRTGCTEGEVLVEGYSYNSTNQAFRIGEATGILKLQLHRYGYEVEVVPPTVVKKFATGKGNADKGAMYEAYREYTGLDLNKELGLVAGKSPCSDIVDSYYIASYAEK